MLFCVFSQATDWYTAPQALGNADGLSEVNAMELSVALGASSPVNAGDTIFLLDGIYTGRYESVISGTINQPISVKSKPGEWAIINGNTNSNLGAALTVNGAYIYFSDFEIAHVGSFSKKEGSTDFSACDGISHLSGVGCKFINLLIHDNPGGGVGSWKQTADTEFYGCIVYNNGFEGSSGELKAHGFYIQNESNLNRKITNNIVFNNFDKGIIAWSACGSNCPNNNIVQNISISYNTSFNSANWRFGDLGGKDNFFTGTDSNNGIVRVDNVNFDNNISYHNTDFTVNGTLFEASAITVGWTNPNSPVVNSTVVNNIFLGRNNSLRFFHIDDLTYSKNISWGRFIQVNNNNNINNWNFDNNSYYTRYIDGNSNPNLRPIDLNGQRTLFSDWQSNFSIDASSTNKLYNLLNQKDFIQYTQNEYNPNLFKIVALKANGANSVNADFSNTGINIPSGTNFKVWDVESYDRDNPISIGITTGAPSISLPMNLTALNTPLGTGFTDNTQKTPNNFGVFLVEFDLPDSNPCDTDISLQNINETSTVDYQASNSITAAGNSTTYTVNNNANAEHVAGVSVTLKDGFIASMGSEYVARIEDCPVAKLENINYFKRDFTYKKGKGELVLKSARQEPVLIEVFPNPFREKIQFKYLGDEKINTYDFKLFNNNGDDIDTNKSLNFKENIFTLTKSDLEEGKYYYHLTINGKLYDGIIIKE
jgi:hypothetical protein